MSEEMNRKQTKAAKHEEITELSDDQLDEAAGGELCTIDAVPAATLDEQKPSRTLTTLFAVRDETDHDSSGDEPGSCPS